MNTETSPAADSNSEIPVRFEVGGQEIEIEKVNRLARRLLQSQATKLRKKFAHLKDFRDEQGRGVTIIIRQPKPGVKSVECVVEYPDDIQDQVEDGGKAVRVAD